jgi:dynein heavy chain
MKHLLAVSLHFMKKRTHDEIMMFQKYIHDFLQRPDIQLLVLTVSSSGVAQPTHSFPSTSSRLKTCYFIRKTAEPVTKENFRSILIFGDVAAKPVDQLAVLVQEVCLLDTILNE